MFYITYRGYVDNLIMSLILALNILLFLIFSLCTTFLFNFSRKCITVKIFNLRFFSDLEFYFSIWNILFLILVLVIRVRVIIFSFSYFHNLHINNFIILYLSFVFRISWLILNRNFYWIILGWDGLGVVSFLLIVFYINVERINNGLFTLFQNRLGDLFFVLFLIRIWNLNINSNLYLNSGIIVLIIGSAVKRAQYPFNAWLLAAIRAPTPISSLVHSSTLVVAGVYILLQYRYCLTNWLNVLKILRLLTLLIRFWGLINERDIKKLIAYSTISHVSLIIFLLRHKLFKIVYFHLSIHAIFKSLIFIAFGFIILSSFHGQDKRLINYSNLNPQLLIMYYYSCLCLGGLPFLTGFFSKDFIIEKIMEYSSRFLEVFLLLIFLSVRIYYRLKLLKLNRNQFSQLVCHKHKIRLWRLILIISVSTFLINLYLSLVFRISLEISSFKFFIYFLILIFIILRLLSNLNFKTYIYSKFSTYNDIKIINYYKLDLYVYFSIFDLLKLINTFSNIKLILIRNHTYFFLLTSLWHQPLHQLSV